MGVHTYVYIYSTVDSVQYHLISHLLLADCENTSLKQPK